MGENIDIILIIEPNFIPIVQIKWILKKDFGMHDRICKLDKYNKAKISSERKDYKAFKPVKPKTNSENNKGTCWHCTNQN